MEIRPTESTEPTPSSRRGARVTPRLVAAVLTVLGLGAAGAGAYAQAGGDGATGTASADDEGTVSARRGADLTPQQQLDEAHAIQRRAASASQRTLQMLDQAHLDGDIVRAPCLDNALTEINAHSHTLDDRVEALESAINTANESRRAHEYVVITVVGQNVVRLEREAGECVGQALFNPDTTQRLPTERDPNGPNENPSQLTPVTGVVVPFIPPPVSPRG